MGKRGRPRHEPTIIVIVLDLWGNSTPVAINALALEIMQAVEARAANPLIRQYGAGPDGATCGDCFYACRGRSPTRPDVLIWTCDKRQTRRGKPAPEHRAWWPACGRFLPVRW